MIKRLRNLILGKTPRRETAQTPQVRGSYDAASNGVENARHWAAADFLSPDAEARESVRRTLRVRARYEVANNSYAHGIVQTLANDTIGTGPRLQILTDSKEQNNQIELAFMRWANAVNLPEKLRVMRLARCQDGESFIILGTNPKNNSEIQLDLQVIEADRVTDPDVTIKNNMVDGIKYDQFGNPVSYRILKFHPGGDEFNNIYNEYIDVPAEYVIHYFREDRPGLHRGIPEITSALPLFAQLRRYTLATLSAAEAAADFAAILYTDSPVDGEAEEISPLDTVELRRNLMLTMPAGWKMAQLDPKQPCSTYGEFKAQILNEIARCVNMPYNVASGNSSGYNYASGRLDHQTYHKSLRVERDFIETRVLDRIYSAWLNEYSRMNRINTENIRHTWFWDGFEHVDPSKEANAVETRLKNFTTTYAAEYAKQGKDWENELRQIAKEKALMEELNLTSAEISEAPKENTPRGDEQEEDSENGE